jgi:hypothetical protein
MPHSPPIQDSHILHNTRLDFVISGGQDVGEKRDKFYKVVIFQVSLGSNSSGTSAKLPETRPYIEIQNK